MRNILIVDDDETAREICQAGVDCVVIGAKVDFGFNGNELVRMASQQDYGLIITDNLMPGICGLKAIENLRAGGIKTPIILMSANLGRNEEEGLRIARASGATDYMAKPLSIRTVSELVKKLYQP